MQYCKSFFISFHGLQVRAIGVSVQTNYSVDFKGIETLMQDLINVTNEELGITIQKNTVNGTINVVRENDNNTNEVTIEPEN